jgi:hypothetical protein
LIATKNVRTIQIIQTILAQKSVQMGAWLTAMQSVRLSRLAQKPVRMEALLYVAQIVLLVIKVARMEVL